ncbi:MAG: DNA mismatch repair endonuclease MutL [Paramuribaculum sp.]|nr:DNA mismatch repair endonuclease MutL [Paramuribaculum sp.]
MSDVIRLLPDSVANQIAAGEVIQRPASVVKELVENAVDAGAKRVQVIIKDAGRTLIQVVDDGKGMSDTDARMAFERHATSKIENAADLFALRTMGFRGEALASIAAVSEVDLRTMMTGESVGTRLKISGSKVESQEPEVCVPGTNMMVKNLFFNVPVRRKFLKKDAVELNHIVHEFERMALVNPGVDMTLVHNESVMHQLLPASFKQRICDLFGKTFEHQMLPVNTSTSLVTIDGYVTLPENSRRRNPLQYFTVNGRHMRHPYFHKAVMQCYERLLPADRQPNYFLNFTVEPSTIDVNIHPTKNEIKFENEAAIWQILAAAVREALGRFNAGPAINFDSDAPDIPVFNPDVSAPHHVEIDTTYNPFESKPRAAVGMHKSPRGSQLDDWEKLYQGFLGDADTQGGGTHAHDSLLNQASAVEIAEGLDSEPALINIDEQFDGNHTLQIKNTYILSPSASGVMIIDQHRAHVKVLYEQFCQSLGEGSKAAQQLLFPDTINVTPAQNALLEEMVGELHEIGFDLCPMTHSSWSINAIPAIASGVNPVELLTCIIDDASQETSVTAESLPRMIALSMARSAAIKSGQRLTEAEREHLITRLLALSQPNFTPDGKRVIIMQSVDELAAKFR